MSITPVTPVTIASLDFLGEAWPDVEVEFGRYGNGNLAVDLLTQSGELLTHASVNLPDHTPAEGCIFVKDYSENEGLTDALERAAVVVRTGKVLGGPFGTTFIEARLLVRPTN